MMPADEPIVPDRSASTSPATFKWPCERRVAHAPHPRTMMGYAGEVDDLSKIKFNGMIDNFRKQPVYLLGTGELTFEEMCPGISAHPKTMIGGKFDA